MAPTLCRRRSMSLHAVKLSSVDGQAYSVEPDVEDALIVPSPAKTRFGSVFKEDMVVLDLKFCSLCKHSRGPLYVVKGLA